MPSITAIVPTYNRATFLCEALDSLVGQTRPVDEIIVWDDGSTDGTEQAVAGMAGPIRYFRSANGGKARALNAALDEARGDLIWICDDDDLALPDAAERLAGLLAETPAAGAAAGSYTRFSDDPQTHGRTESGPGYWPALGQGSVLRHLLEDIFLFQNATLVRRTLYEKVGPFREDLARSIDYDMVVRLALNAPVVVTEEVVFKQRKHDGERGPESARHAAARSDEVWKAADRAVFEPFRESVPLELYTRFFDGDLAPRAGRLQRGCVYARRTDWARAIEDFNAAAAMDGGTDLARVERDICRRAMAGKHGIAEAMMPEMRQRLGRLAQSGPVGARIAQSLARGMVWRIRHAVKSGDLQGAARMAQFTAALSLAARPHGGLQAAPALSEHRASPLLP